MKVMYRLERIFYRCSKMLFYPYSFLWYFRMGKKNRYPTCCIVHFAWDGARQKRGMAVRRGIIFVSEKSSYVPCWFHKGRHPEWAPYERFPKPRNQLKLFLGE